MSTDVEDLLWFSHSTAEYEVQSNAGGKHRKKFVLKKDRSIKLDWDNCTVNIARILPDGNVRFVIRSMTNRNSDYMGGIPVQLRFMLAIDINPAAISELRIDRNYSLAESRRKRLPEQAKKIEHDRWVFNLGDRAEVWEWTREGTDMRSSRVYKLHRSIRKFLDSPGRLRTMYSGCRQTGLTKSSRSFTSLLSIRWTTFCARYTLS